MIPITTVKFCAAEQELVLEVLQSGRVAQGPMVAKFEDIFAELCGVKHAIAVNSGTTALVAAIQVLDLQPGDQVLTSPFTFVATLNAILEAGATATFADISEDDFNLSPESVENAITAQTKVIMPVHLYGQMADMDAISKIASQHKLRIVEDSAQSHGAAQGDHKAGSFDLGSFSFYATKNLTTGEGGLITTNDDELADRLRVLRNQGMRARYQYEVAGHNYRLTDLQAALVIPQLGRYADVVTQRQANAEVLSNGLSHIPGIVVPQQLPGRSHVWHQYTIRVTEESGLDRDELSTKLDEAGVGSGIYYPKMVFDYETYANRADVIVGEYPVAQRVAQQALSLPVHTHLSSDDLTKIIETVEKIVSAAR